ncbi:MAG: hypothetical protein Q8O89_02105 [Nanoarchaeota archaeon]|nr:hypothetical protein [Nanoarchaeota archaeon]
MVEKHNKKVLFFIILISLSILVFYLPILQNINNWGIRDWSFFQVSTGILKKSLVENHQVPLWDPFSCGGRPLISNPQAAFISPLSITILLFGEIIGLKLNMLFLMIFGGIGCYCLARELKIGKISALLVPLVFTFSSYYSAYLVEGHYWNIVYGLFPFAFYFFVRAQKEIKFLIISGLLIAFMLFEGHSYGIAFSVLFLGIFSVLLTIKSKDKKPLLSFIFLAIIILFFVAVKIFPVMSYVIENPRNVASENQAAYTLNLFWQGLTNSEQGAYDHQFPNQVAGWFEYSMYIGLIVVIIFLIGCLLLFKRDWPLIIACLIFIFLTFGQNLIINFWGLLQHLPVFSSMHHPTRFKIFVLLCIALISAKLLSKFEKLESIKISKKINIKNASTAIVILILALVAISLFRVSYGLSKEGFIIPPIDVKNEQFHYEEAAEVSNPYTKDKVIPQMYESTYGSKSYINFLRGVGTKNCYDSVYVKRGGEAKIIWNSTIMNYQENPKYRGEVFFESDINENRLLDKALNNAHIESMDFQGFVLVVDKVSDSDMLILSQNYEKGWNAKGSMDNTVYERNGLIGVKVNENTTKIVLTYAPKSYIIGLWITIFSTIFFLFLFFRWDNISFTKKIDQFFSNN